MAKLIAVHTMALRPGVTREMYEQFIRDHKAEWKDLPGVTGYSSYCDRGERAGKIAAIYVFDDVATRDRYFPASGQMSTEAQAWFDSNADYFAKYREIATLPGDSEYAFSDYVVVAEV